MEVAHHGGVFVTTTVERGTADERALLAMNEAILTALGLARGATHAEFIRDAATGEFYFLEVAARVGGAFIAETLEAASGLNLWREWARLELSTRSEPYTLPSLRHDHAGLALALARQEWPDTSAFDDPEIVERVPEAPPRRPHRPLARPFTRPGVARLLQRPHPGRVPGCPAAKIVDPSLDRPRATGCGTSTRLSADARGAEARGAADERTPRSP